jgi:hypothetical protein
MKSNTLTIITALVATALAAPLPQAWSLNGPLGGISYDNRPQPGRGPPPSAWNSPGSAWGPSAGSRPGSVTVSGPVGAASLGSDGSWSLTPGKPGQGTGISYTPAQPARGRGWNVDAESAEEKTEVEE